MVEPQRIGDHAAAEDHLERDLFAEVRQRIARAVRVVLHGDLRELALTHPMARHQRAGHQRGERRHRGAVRALVGVERAPDQLRHLRRRQVRHLLATDHDDRVGQARGDLREAGVERRRARRRRRLDPNDGDVREAHVRGDVGGEVAVAQELLGVHGRDDDRVGPLAIGASERGVRGDGHQVLQRLLEPPHAGHVRAGDPHVTHGGPQIAGRVAKGQLLRGGPPASRRRRRRRHAEISDEPQQVGPLQPESPRRVRAVAACLMERRLDESSFEVGDRAVIADRRRWSRRSRSGQWVHDRSQLQRACQRRTNVFAEESGPPHSDECPAGLACCR